MSQINRRELLLERMATLEPTGMDCRNCSGTCCTYEANSMMVTPLEAVELFEGLQSMNYLTPEFKMKLEAAVASYRLEAKFPNTRSYLRKTYTCPLFIHGELGCPLPREIKPYGCLAFNSHHVTLKASEHCFSETDLLEEREKLYLEHEKAKNEEIRKNLSIFWDKAPIPVALLDLWSKEKL